MYPRCERDGTNSQFVVDFSPFKRSGAAYIGITRVTCWISSSNGASCVSISSRLLWRANELWSEVIKVGYVRYQLSTTTQLSNLFDNEGWRGQSICRLISFTKVLIPEICWQLLFIPHTENWALRKRLQFQMTQTQFSKFLYCFYVMVLEAINAVCR